MRKRAPYRLMRHADDESTKTPLNHIICDAICIREHDTTLRARASGPAAVRVHLSHEALMRVHQPNAAFNLALARAVNQSAIGMDMAEEACRPLF